MTIQPIVGTVILIVMVVGGVYRYNCLRDAEDFVQYFRFSKSLPDQRVWQKIQHLPRSQQIPWKPHEVEQVRIILEQQTRIVKTYFRQHHPALHGAQRKLHRLIELALNYDCPENVVNDYLQLARTIDDLLAE